MSTHVPRSHRLRFTLIELLVVVAIIAVLAAMLLPALSKARESARIATCTNNLHQTYLAIDSYGGDMEEYPSSVTWFPPDDVTLVPEHYGYGRWDVASVLDMLVTFKYLPNNKSLLCPTNAIGQGTTLPYTFFGTWYGMLSPYYVYNGPMAVGGQMNVRGFPNGMAYMGYPTGTGASGLNPGPINHGVSMRGEKAVRGMLCCPTVLTANPDVWTTTAAMEPHRGLHPHNYWSISGMLGNEFRDRNYVFSDGHAEWWTRPCTYGGL